MVGAPSSIGIRPYDDGGARRLDLAPAALRARGLINTLDATDFGDVVPPPYRDFTRVEGRPRNEDELVAYTVELAQRIAAAMADGYFVLVLGGDCSIVLASLLALRLNGVRRPGLAYADAHADFATPRTSHTGSAASMCLALALGSGDTRLARLSDDGPLVHGHNTVLLGRREGTPTYYDAAKLRETGVLEVNDCDIHEHGASAAGEFAWQRLNGAVDSLWIHLDADVMDPRLVPAVDSPEPGGLDVEMAAAVLAHLVNDPRARGMQLTIYDPRLDADGASGDVLASLLVRLLGRGTVA